MEWDNKSMIGQGRIILAAEESSYGRYICIFCVNVADP